MDSLLDHSDLIREGEEYLDILYQEEEVLSKTTQELEEEVRQIGQRYRNKKDEIHRVREYLRVLKGESGSELQAKAKTETTPEGSLDKRAALVIEAMNKLGDSATVQQVAWHIGRDARGVAQTFKRLERQGLISSEVSSTPASVTD